jgi:uncharacterized protein
MDEVGLLSDSEKENLSKLIYEIHTHQGPQITIFIVNDLQGYAIEDFSIRVAEQWKLGTKQAGNGILITIAKAERKMRIEVGDGIEGEITDYDANVYINKVLAPAFREGEYFEGLKIVIADISQKFKIDPSSQGIRHIRRVAPPAINGKLASLFPFIILGLIFIQLIFRKHPFVRGIFTGGGIAGSGLFLIPAAGFGFIFILFILGLIIGLVGLHNFLYALASSGHGGGYRGQSGGGFGGGGGWSGGGGGFSGGGSSGNW